MSNDTRVFATAEVDLPGGREEDVARVIGIINDVGQGIAADPA